jgi:DNA primase
VATVGARRGRYDQASAERAAAFHRLVEDTKARHNILDVAKAAGAVLSRAGGRAMKARCLVHHEKTPSLNLYPGEGNFHCYGCGWNGDVIELVMGAKGLTFVAAMQWLGAANLPLFDPAERAKMIEEDSAERLEAMADARAFFADAETVTADDPGGRYLAARGILLPVAPTVRFGMIPSWRDPETGQWGRTRPALVCGCQNEISTFVAIQRIFVDGPEPDKAACKLSLGSLKGAALRLGPVHGEITTTEGPEDGMSIAQDAPDRSVWVPCGTGLWSFMRFPAEVHTIVLAGQNDAPGRAAVIKAGDTFLEQGFATRDAWPAERFKDWNLMLRGIAA